MISLTLDNITMEELNIRINDLRDVLNELCCIVQNTQVQEERLLTSRNLDELIVKYMKGIGATHVASGIHEVNYKSK